jgi:hypothetical protein
MSLLRALFQWLINQLPDDGWEEDGDGTDDSM